MRRERYVKAYAEHLPYLRKIAMARGLDYDEANEVVGKCAEQLLKTKKYTSIQPSTLKAFLRTNIRFRIQDFKKAELIRSQAMARLPDVEEWWIDQSTVQVAHVHDLPPIEERECPFCFKANLNEYGACAMCHTIVPSHIRLQRAGVVYSKESLAVEFDFNTPLDVHNAIAKLSPLEQKVVMVVGLGNESLESFAFDNEVSKSSLVRIWVNAKEKLQVSLREYAPNHLSHRGTNAFRRALQRVEKQREL